MYIYTNPIPILYIINILGVVLNFVLRHLQDHKVYRKEKLLLSDVSVGIKKTV